MSALPFPEDPTDGHNRSDAQTPLAFGQPPSSGQPSNDTQSRPAAGDPSSDLAIGRSTTKVEAPDRTPYHLLASYAGFLDELEATRIANANRVRAIRDDLGGAGKEVETLAILVEQLEALEHGAELQLKRTLRQHPLGGWVKKTVGIGEKQGARLLAATGDPYWNDLHGRPRTVSELWAYSGYSVQGGAAPRRKKGEKANWSSDAKVRAFLCAESCIKQARSPYRKVYDDARTHYADAVHEHACVRCGPKGQPAQPGSPLSAGHQHARAMRKVSKEILKDLWRESKRIHGEGAA